MINGLRITKGPAFTLFCFAHVFLLACSRSQEIEWKLEQTLVANKCYNSGKLFLPAANQFRGIELELVQYASGIRMYLNVFSLPFPTHTEDSTKTEILITIDEDEHPFTTHCFQGGQRLLLPPEATSLLITSLMEDHSITIASGRYCATIVSTRFSELYAKLNQIFL